MEDDSYDGTDGQRTDDDGTHNGTDRRIEDGQSTDDDGDGTDTTGRTNDIYSSKVSSTTLRPSF